jgi:hypothetical protein
MAAEEINIPEAPQCLPKKERAEWAELYAKAFRQAQRNFPEDEAAQRQAALREANRMLQVPEPKSHEEALALPAHQVLLSEVVDGELRIVTTDAKRYKFPVPDPDKKKK